MKKKKDGIFTVFLVAIITVIESVVIWLSIPFADAYFLTGSYARLDYILTFRKNWLFYLAIILLATSITNTVACVRYMKKRRSDGKRLVPYEEFEKMYTEAPDRCELAYENFTIVLEGCGYSVVKEGKILVAKEYESMQELFEAQIVSSRTLKELWQELK